MIVKMKFISITGPKDDIDRVAGQYLSKYEIQLENAVSELKTVQNIAPFAESNPYKEIVQKASVLVDSLSDAGSGEEMNLSIDECIALYCKGK